MNKRNDTLLFPGGKCKALTLSYDDGVRQDRRLVEITTPGEEDGCSCR